MEDILVGTTGLIVIVIAAIWAVLYLLAPFFWYGTNKRCKEISEKLDELIDIQRRSLYQRERPADAVDDDGITPRR